MRVLALGVAAAVGVLSGGCLVQSLDPFYTGSTLARLPGFEGRWEMVRDFDHVLRTNETVAPWCVGPSASTQMPIYRVTSCEASTDRTGVLSVAFFEIGGQTYCDVSVGQSDKYNKYLSAHQESVHTLGLVALSNDTLKVRMLNRPWFQKAATNGTFTMSWSNRGHKSFLVTQQKPDWRTFLETHCGDAELFSTNRYFEFRRAKENAPETR